LGTSVLKEDTSHLRDHEEESFEGSHEEKEKTKSESTLGSPEAMREKTLLDEVVADSKTFSSNHEEEK
jgi:hypothetical protein